MPDYTEQLNQERNKDRLARSTKKSKKTASVLEPSQITDAEFLIIGLIAAISDLVDYLGLGLLSFRIIDLFTTAILGLWCIFRLKKFPGARFGTTFLIELIPFLGDISPTWTIFIATVYLEQRGYLSKIKMLKKIIK